MLRADGIRSDRKQTELAAMALADAKVRAQVYSLPATGARRIDELILPDTQLLVAAGTAPTSIFFFAWVLMKLWLSGR